MTDTDLFWWLANTRYQMYENRLLAGVPVPSGDPILDGNRFTNTFRAADRVSQRLIRIQLDGPQDPESVALRTLVFKIFNKESTWDALVQGLGAEPDAQSWDVERAKAVLDGVRTPLFSSAYQMVNSLMSGVPKHYFYLDTLTDLLHSGEALRLMQQPSLQQLIDRLEQVPGVGTFLSYQFAVDLNYVLGFSENDAVVAGPGAVRGLRKLFGDARMSSEKIRQLHAEAEERGPWLLDERPMHLIDVQNVLCEYDKYTRVAYEGRRMRQRYRVDPRPLPDPVWPEPWGI